jgi:arginase family enzyme
MHIRVLDLDGSVRRQNRLMDRHRPAEHDLAWWGPRIRLGCSFSRFQLFERALAATLADEEAAGPALTFYGSGDFHHVSLALLRRLPGPCNLLVLDNHPDWMRGVPFLHCGTWLYHAARLPQVRSVFHVGGNVDFDNGFRRLAPWPLLRSGKLTVFPAVRCFKTGTWTQVAHEPVRPKAVFQVTDRRLRGLLYPFRQALKSYPLYISLDKDVMTAAEAPANWDSGHLHLAEVEDILRCFVDAARGELAGMDIVGDWSPVRTKGLFRRLLHWTEHPRLALTPAAATCSNERANLTLLNALARMQTGISEAQPVAA